MLPASRGPVFYGAASPRGDAVAVAHETGLVRLLSRGGQPLGTLRWLLGDVRGMTFSPDGEQILTSHEAGRVRLWSRDGKEVARYEGLTKTARHPRFSADGQRVLALGEWEGVRIWERSGASVAVLEGRGPTRYETQSYDISPQGHVVTCGLDCVVRLWNLDGEEIRVIDERRAAEEGHALYPHAVRFSPSGDRILVLYVDRIARLFDLNGREVAATSPRREQGERNWSTARLLGASFSPDGSHFLTYVGARAYLWDRDGAEVAAIPEYMDILDASFSPDGRRFVVLSDEARIFHVGSEAVLRLADERCLRSFTAEERSRYAPLLELPGGAR